MAAIDNDAGADRLETYRAKRTASETPEPFAGTIRSGGNLFVVQKHSARRLHYDLRLEVDGVLKSWAVPRGPSYDQADKRLAVQTEDHPLDYADFEGIIPEGNYGAGAVIVWDRGIWVPRIPYDEGFAKGKLLFELRGYKLHGLWTLVRIKNSESEREWLLIKERDAWLTSEAGKPLAETSILSGMTVDELKEGGARAAALADDLQAAGAEPAMAEARDVELMLAQTRETPFGADDWVFEIKYDGYRLLASRTGTQSLLLSRRGHDITATFPEIAQAVRSLPFDRFVLDGEVVVHDERGFPSFQRLQKRGRLSRRMDIQRASIEAPAALYVFDLLMVQGLDLRPLPLSDRKAALRRVAPELGALRYVDHVVGRGEEFFEQIRVMGLEGMVGKRADSPYIGGRSELWQKVRSDRTDDFVIAGFSEPKGSRSGVGALHLAAYDGGGLVYAGRVGTGFTQKQLDDLREGLERSLRDDAPCTGETLPTGAGHHWVDPEYVVEVRYKEWTEGGLLRHPVFQRLRPDKPLEDCIRPGTEAVFGSDMPVEDDTPPPLVPFSNLDKVFWPEERYTKGDLIDYYRDVAQWLLPYLEDRPLVLTRFPDGIDGKSFFQKDAPGWVPDWARTEKVWSEDSGKETNYFICEDVESLLYVINLGSIPLHVWSSRLAALERPDWCILDLDPKEAPFSFVIETALSIRDLCSAIGLPCFVKTSGSTGMHVLVPLGGQCTYAQCKSFGELLGRVTASRIPDVATTTRALGARKGRVYIDFVQNGHGKLLVSPLCVRPLPGAPVSMPLDWADVRPGLAIGNFTIETVPPILRERNEDPFLPVITTRPDLAAALGILSREMEGLPQD